MFARQKGDRPAESLVGFEVFAHRQDDSPVDAADQPPQKKPRIKLSELDRFSETFVNRLFDTKEVADLWGDQDSVQPPPILGKKQVRTQPDRKKVMQAFTLSANGRAFTDLMPDQQATEVTRISKLTGYRPSGVETTLNGGINRPVDTKAARNKVTSAFAKAGNGQAFGDLAQGKQDTEVTRISKLTGYNRTGVRKTLNGEGTVEARTKTARNEIMNVFTQAANGRAFTALTPEQQATEVTRISRQTGYNQAGVMNTLNGWGNRQVDTKAARNEIANAFTLAANGQNFSDLTSDQQTAEMARIAGMTGYHLFGVSKVLNDEGTVVVRTHVAREEITNMFTQAANGRAFSELTPDQQTAEVTRISRITGYQPGGVTTTLNGKGNIQVKAQKARAQIINEFTLAANGRAFSELPQDKQDAEVERISRLTGYRLSGVRTTLDGVGNVDVETQAARVRITQAFTEAANGQAFNDLTQNEQDAEVTRISRLTGYKPVGVRKTLSGE